MDYADGFTMTFARLHSVVIIITRILKNVWEKIYTYFSTKRNLSPDIS